MTTHTPGPWRAMTGNSPAMVRAANGDNIANDVPNKADALLFAAAPELLAALQLMAEHWPEQQPGSPAFDAYSMARAAIEKATQP